MSRWRKWWLLGMALLVFSDIACNRRRANIDTTPPSANDEEQKPSATESAAPSVPASPLDWPKFNGAKGDNVSLDTGLLKKWPKDGPNLLWTCKRVGRGCGCPSVAAGSIYVSGNLNGKTTVTALDLNGKIRWQTPSGSAWTGVQPGAKGTPTVDGECVYHESPHGMVVCLDATTGKKMWEVNILHQFDSYNLTGGMAESVLVDGNKVICCPGGNDVSVVALDKNTGAPVWTAAATGDLAAYATPVLIEHKGLRIVLAMNQRGLLGVNAATGDLLFQHFHRTPRGANATSPLFHDGQIFITSGYGAGSELLELTVDGETASVQRVWKSKELDDERGGVVLLNGFIYGNAHQANEGSWVCLAWSDGAKKYAERGIGRGSLTCADGMLYCWNEEGQVALVPATPEGYEPVSRFTIPNKGPDPTWAHPVVCGGRLYLRCGSFLYAYDVKAAK
jgi:outer membrane protein assembly factor BamB